MQARLVHLPINLRWINALSIHVVFDKLPMPHQHAGLICHRLRNIRTEKLDQGCQKHERKQRGDGNSSIGE